MIAKFLQKWGITISKLQEMIFKLAILYLAVISPYWFLRPIAEGANSKVNIIWLGNETQFFYYADQLSSVVTTLMLFHTVLVIFFTTFTLIAFLLYLGMLSFKPGFRESEMSRSVNFVETDEREQLETMRATRRAYMVVNFALLIGWLGLLIYFHFSEAFLLFVIQLIGAISFRNNIRLIKHADR